MKSATDNVAPVQIFTGASYVDSALIHTLEEICLPPGMKPEPHPQYQSRAAHF